MMRMERLSNAPHVSWFLYEIDLPGDGDGILVSIEGKGKRLIGLKCS